MGLFQKIAFDRFDLGLFTAPDAMDLPAGAATVAENCNFENVGQLSKSNGAKVYKINGSQIPTIPTGLTIDGMCAFEVTIPSARDILLITGTKNGLRKFYITPYWKLDGTLVSNDWLDLTEAVTTTLASTPSSSTSFTFTSADVSSETDYYKGWWMQIWDTSATISLGWDLIIGYNGTTKTATTKFGISSAASGDHVLICRHPIFKGISSTPTSGNANIAQLEHFSVDDRCTFAVANERVYIYTGNNKSVSSAPDLHLSFVGSSGSLQGYFNDNDLDFRGFVLEHAHPFAIENPTAANDYVYLNLTVQNETYNPLPYDSTGIYNYYLFYGAVLYDGFQEGNHYYTASVPTQSFLYRSAQITDASKKIAINVRHRPHYTTPRKDEYNETTDATGYNSVLSRRAKGILIYAARGKFNSSGGYFQFSTPFFLIKTIPIDDSSWYASSPSPPFYYAYDFNFTGVDWDFAQEFDSVTNRGHIVERVGATANQAVQVAGSWCVGPVFTDQKRNDIVIIAPTSSKYVGGVVMPCVLPEKSLKLDSSPHGIPKIIAMAAHLDRLLVFGREIMGVAVINGVNSKFITSFPVGLTSKRGVQVLDDICYFTSHDGIYAFDGRLPVRISDPINTSWLALSDSTKSSCFTGINKKQILIYAGGTIYVYDTAKGHWRTETADLTWTEFARGHNGTLLATNGLSIYQLDADNYTTSRALRWKSGEIATQKSYPRRMRVVYSSQDLISVKVYDHALSTIDPVDTVWLVPSETEMVTKISSRVSRLVVEVQSTSSTNSVTIRKLEIGRNLPTEK